MMCVNACCIYSVKPTWRHSTASALTSLISIWLRGEGHLHRAESVLQTCVMGRCAICIFMYCYRMYKRTVLAPYLVQNTTQNTDFSLKTVHGNAPYYMKFMLMEHILSRSGLRLEQLYKVLSIPHTQRKTFAPRSFSDAGPTYCNALPEDVKKSKDVATYKQRLKNCVFEIAFKHLLTVSFYTNLCLISQLVIKLYFSKFKF